MSAGLRRAARAVRGVATDRARAAAPEPERFRVQGVQPLELVGLDTDVTLHEEDEDVEVHAPVREAALAVGDLVWVKPRPEADGSGIAGWHATHVGSRGAGIILGGVYTLATLPAEGRNYEIVLVTNAPVGQRWKGWDGGSWRSLG